MIRQLLAAGELTLNAIAMRVGVTWGTVKHRKHGPAPRPDVGVCPTCRHRVTLPCVACSLPSVTAAPRPFRFLRIEPLGLNLKPNDYQRYLEVRVQKQAAGEMPEFPDSESYEPRGDTVDDIQPLPRHWGYQRVEYYMDEGPNE